MEIIRWKGQNFSEVVAPEEEEEEEEGGGGEGEEEEEELYRFRTVLLSMIRSYPLYTQQWCMSYRFIDCFRAAGSGSHF
jgi:hypothetical protein